MNNIIEYGLCNVHIAPLLTDDIQGNITYGTPVAVPTSKSLSMKNERTSDNIYADNVVVLNSSKNTGMSGEITFLSITDEIRELILNEEKMENGAMMSTANVRAIPFALMFQIEGDIKNTRHCLYKCFATQPELASKTAEDKNEPNELKLEITSVPLPTGDIKLKITQDQVGYDTFFSNVMLRDNILPTPPIKSKGGEK